MPNLLRSALLVLCALPTASHAAPPKVVVSIAPVHSLVWAVMDGIAEPGLLVAGNASPHDYSLRPSEARALHNATLIFRVGAGLENFLDKPMTSLAAGTRVVDLVAAPGLVLLELRDDDDWPSEGHGDPSRATSADDQPASRRAHVRTDPHVWLSPVNAAAMLATIRDELMAIDAPNAERYFDNTRRALDRLAEHERGWRKRLAPLTARPFVVFHDAYQYLENYFGLNGIGAVSSSPGRQPSAMHVRALLKRMNDTGVRCLFREPQFSSALVDMMVQSSGATAAVLDPLGSALDADADAWFGLMNANVESLAVCLSQS